MIQKIALWSQWFLHAIRRWSEGHSKYSHQKYTSWSSRWICYHVLRKIPLDPFPSENPQDRPNHHRHAQRRLLAATARIAVSLTSELKRRPLEASTMRPSCCEDPPFCAEKYMLNKSTSDQVGLSHMKRDRTNRILWRNRNAEEQRCVSKHGQLEAIKLEYSPCENNSVLHHLYLKTCELQSWLQVIDLQSGWSS